MHLELRTFPVHEVRFSHQTRWQDGVLDLDRNGLLQVVMSDARIVSADIEVAKPGDSTRITTVNDVIEPRTKVDGPGSTYPGVAGRPVTTVGEGTTNRLDGVSVVEVAEVRAHDGVTGNAWPFIDTSGPMADLSPYGGLNHVCLVMKVDSGLSTADQNDATQRAALQVADTIASATVGLEPPLREVFDTSGPAPSLPKIAYIGCFNSPEHYSNSLNARGNAIYGLTRLTPPWLLHPNELIDGAICGKSSWMLVNNPVVTGLSRRHGRDLDFVGCIAIRTRWGSQAEKDTTSLQAAKMVDMLGADGVVVTWDSGGNDFMEVIRTVQACEKRGVRTVLLTYEESPDTGGPPLLEPLSEADAIVTTGYGADYLYEDPSLPAVEHVIGNQELLLTDDPHAADRVIAASSRIARFRSGDHYGFSRLSAFAF